MPGNIHHNSGGNAYNARLVRGLRKAGTDVEVLSVEGAWPEASAKDRRRLGSLLVAWEPGAGSGQAVGVVDGLVAVGAPDELEYAAKAGKAPLVLAHMIVPEASGPAALESEGRALRAASGVICTSSSTAYALKERHGLRGVRVALPGVDPAPVAQGSRPPNVVVVAALLPVKDQLLTVAALALLKDLEWSAALVGSDQADPEYASRVRSAVMDNGLNRRIRLTGELLGEALEREWEAANLSLLVSQAEAFGMVVTESLARGIPVVVRQGTGAVEALGLAGLRNDDGGLRLPGLAVPLAPDDPEAPAALAEVLRRWLEDAGLRQTWRTAALDARDRLPGWDRTAAAVLAAVEGTAG
ncbi:glycosyltransferase family 4 protein [Pseudarthrobacter sp. NamE2]|uniref:glycosyltransferase family 4 protein n=1 Tax=Pseudarthrobacter sp. NamE2 TaxID=2576838 RepID=UPI003511BC64